MNPLLRILKHRAWDDTDTRRAIGPEVVQRLSRRPGERLICIDVPSMGIITSVMRETGAGASIG